VLAARDQLDRVLEAMKELPERQRKALELRAYRKLSYDQIAEVMGATTTAVKKLVCNARKHLAVAAL
jgi:RNA polymerase sigma factor (sigma-70 family)